MGMEEAVGWWVDLDVVREPWDGAYARVSGKDSPSRSQDLCRTVILH